MNGREKRRGVERRNVSSRRKQRVCHEETRCAERVTEIRNPARRGTTVVPIRRYYTTYHRRTVNARVPFFTLPTFRTCTFAYTHAHTHTHAHRHNGATNYSGQNGTSSIVHPRVRFHRSTKRQQKGHATTTLRTERIRVRTHCPSRSHRPGWAILNFNLNLSVR